MILLHFFSMHCFFFPSHRSSFKLIAVCCRVAELSFPRVPQISIDGDEHVCICPSPIHITRSHDNFVSVSYSRQTQLYTNSCVNINKVMQCRYAYRAKMKLLNLCLLLN